VHIIPGDPVRAMLGYEADAAAVQAVRSSLNLDKPLIQQYCIWASNFLRGDFGTSLVLNKAIRPIIFERIPVSLAITIPAFVISNAIAIIIGIISATHRGSFWDQFLTIWTTAFAGMPDFWIGVMLMFLFSVKLGWLPSMGYISPAKDFVGYLRCAALPVMVDTLVSFAWTSRQVRTSMLDVLNQDYIRTARANGIPRSRIYYRHALRNTLIPIVTLLVIQVRSLVGGSLLIEQIFSIAGMGRLIYTSVTANDFLTIQAITMIIAIFVILCNLLLDFSYGWIDPRVRAGGK
jgi:peptide/nickel transport system permease protein